MKRSVLKRPIEIRSGGVCETAGLLPYFSFQVWNSRSSKERLAALTATRTAATTTNSFILVEAGEEAKMVDRDKRVKGFEI